jgi:hypothetical protein
MITRSGMVELTIYNNSFQTPDLTIDFVPKEKTGNSKPVVKIVERPGRILFISRSGKDSAEFSATTPFNLSERKYFQIAWNVMNTASKSIDTLIVLKKKDTQPLLVILFSANTIFIPRKNLKTPLT